MAHCQESNFFLWPLPHLSFFSIFSCFQEFCTSLMLLWYCHNKHSSVLQKKTVPLCWLCVLCVSELDQLMDSLPSTGTRYCITFGYLTNTSYTETILYIFLCILPNIHNSKLDKSMYSIPGYCLCEIPFTF